MSEAATTAGETITAHSAPSLSQVTLWVDWDAVASMILSLRMHLFDFGTVPAWNFMFCGGRPELSVPFSWAYTWPSLFAYAFPPVTAILAVWIALSAVGFLATRALLRGWTGSGAGASVGATLYVLSGIFAARFNAGHITFAFFHLVPVLMWTFERGFARGLAKEPVLRAGLCMTGASLLFMTGALPHPLLHFYPAFVALIAYRVATTAADRGFATSLRAAAVPVAAHALGAWLAAYKLWPVIRWQLAHPREGVKFEAYTLFEVFRNTTIFVGDYLDPQLQQAWHVYPAWGYNAYVGPVPWLCALLVVGALALTLREQASGGRDSKRWHDRRAAIFGLLLIALGMSLALGNDHPASPAHWFRHLPVLDGIRCFNRYQVLIVFGLAVSVSQATALVQAELAQRPALRRAVVAGLAAVVIVPVAQQTAALVRTIGAVPNAQIVLDYPKAPATDAPLQVWNRRLGLRAAGHQTALLEGGYWIANCYSNLSLPGEPIPPDQTLTPLSQPAPLRVVEIGAAHATLAYPGPAPRPDGLYLRVLDDFSTETAAGHSTGTLLTIRARPPGVIAGATTSVAGLLATAAFFLALGRRERRQK